MNNISQSSTGLIQLNYAEIQRKISEHKLFGLEDVQSSLFHFCKTILTADDNRVKQLSFYDLTPSVLLYGPPNTGKTSLCYLLFDEIKKKITNEINFYTVDIGKMLSPELGQSSRNIGQIFQDLQKSNSEGVAAFLLLDELDTFCMSRSRIQEHDAVRRAMTSLMLELDKLHPSKTKGIFVFGITNICDFIDTALVRRFSLKYLVNATLSLEEFKNYLTYLNRTINHVLEDKDIQKLYKYYGQRSLTLGDIKAFYRILFVNSLHPDKKTSITNKMFELFETGFSSNEHIIETRKELYSG